MGTVAEAGFWGYRRADGRVGVRNQVLVLPGGFIAGQVCRLVPGVATLRTADKGYGRTARDRETIFRVLAGLGRNPNVYGVLLVDSFDWGYVFDRIVGAGGGALFGETTEILGAEEILQERAAMPEVAAQLGVAAAEMRERGRATGQEWADANLLPANRAGGLGSPAQKSRG